MKRHGVGTYKSGDNEYVGDWKDDAMDGQGKFARTFRNEMNRIFMDRLTTEDDLKMVGGELQEAMSEGFSEVMEEVMVDPIIFGEYEKCVGRLVEEAEDPKLYQDLTDYKRIRKICDEVLEAYNVEHKPMTLVLFESALEHLTRISRIPHASSLVSDHRRGPLCAPLSSD